VTNGLTSTPDWTASVWARLLRPLRIWAVLLLPALCCELARRAVRRQGLQSAVLSALMFGSEKWVLPVALAVTELPTLCSCDRSSCACASGLGRPAA